MSSGIMRVWCCDVERCRAMHVSAVTTGNTPSSFKVPEGWWAARTRLGTRGGSTGSIYLCPGHADRAVRYLAEMASWNRQRDEWAKGWPEWWTTEDGRTRFRAASETWFDEHPRPMLPLGGVGT